MHPLPLLLPLPLPSPAPSPRLHAVLLHLLLLLLPTPPSLGAGPPAARPYTYSSSAAEAYCDNITVSVSRGRWFWKACEPARSAYNGVDHWYNLYVTVRNLDQCTVDFLCCGGGADENQIVAAVGYEREDDDDQSKKANFGAGSVVEPGGTVFTVFQTDWLQPNSKFRVRVTAERSDGQGGQAMVEASYDVNSIMLPLSNDDVARSLLQSSSSSSVTPPRLVFSAFLYGHDANMAALCDGVVLGVVELERVFGIRYFDLHQVVEKELSRGSSRGSNSTRARKVALAMPYLQQAVARLNELVQQSGSDACGGGAGSSGGSSSGGSSSAATVIYDIGIVVDPYTPQWMADALDGAVALRDSAAWTTVNHHYSHALLAWYDSPFYHRRRHARRDDVKAETSASRTNAATATATLVLSYDGWGNDGSFNIYYSSLPGSTPSDRGGRNIVDQAEQQLPLPLDALTLLESKPISLGQTYVAAALIIPHFWTKNGTVPPCPYRLDPRCELSLPGTMMAFAALGRPRIEWFEGVRVLLTSGSLPQMTTGFPPVDVVATDWGAVFGPEAFVGTGSAEGSQEFHRLRFHPDDPVGDARRDQDFAATVQAVFEMIVVDQVRASIQALAAGTAGRHPPIRVDSIAVTGGCALNVRANTILQNHFKMPVYVPSAPGDGGLSIGGAYHVMPPPPPPPPATATAPLPPPSSSSSSPPSHSDDNNLAYLGLPLFDLSHLPGLARERGATVTNVSEIAGLLVQGMVGALVRGRQELGPRALGHRSLVAVPTSIEMRDRMNRLKSRQWYRPCAPMLTRESAGTLFEQEGEDALDAADTADAAGRPLATAWSSPYMSFAPLLKPWAIERFPAVAHVDGTARPQTVEREHEPWLHELLLRVGEVIGAPVIINTSFNGKGEPIINTARRALELLDTSEDLSFVVIEEWLFLKQAGGGGDGGGKQQAANE